LSAALLVGYGLARLPANWLETDLLALLPEAEQDPLIRRAIDQFNGPVNQRLLWLVGADTVDDAVVQADAVKAMLAASGLFTDAQAPWRSARFTETYQQLFPYRFQLLSAKDRQRLEQDPDALVQEALAALYGPLGQLRLSSLERDPLFLFGDYLAQRGDGKARIRDDTAVIEGDGRHWALIVTRLRASTFGLEYQQELLDLVDSARDRLGTEADLLVSGLPLFTAHGSASARSEITTIGVGSLLGVLGLLLVTFHSLRPILLSATAIGFGVACALLAGVGWFGRIHIITLVFGSSLIGVSIDYALHYFVNSFTSASWRPVAGLAHVLPGITLGLVTSCLGYLSLASAPFPGLQQVALFSVVGLAGAWFTVVFLFPALLHGFQPAPRPAMLRFADLWQRQWPARLRRRAGLLAVAAIGVAVAGLARLSPQDDIRQLQSPPPQLMAADKKIRALLPHARDSQFFLVEGQDPDSWWQNEQALATELARLRHDGVLSGFEALSAFWPSPQRQIENRRLIQRQLVDSGRLQRYFETLNLRQAVVEQALEDFRSATSDTGELAIEPWLATADEGLRSLWLGCDARACRSLVALDGIRSLAPLTALAQTHAHVRFVNHVDDLSAMMGRYRHSASGLLVGAFGVITAVLLVLLGWRSAVAIVLVPVFAVTAALAGVGWVGGLFNLFNVFALLLVLGISIDYAIFFRLSGGTRTTTALGVILAALTTLLAFGLLAASDTAVVHAFGLTIFIGISAALLVAPLVRSRETDKPVGVEQ
jgi:predicted exporter